jgi:L-2-hydroxyglutarate oxidase LhgO
MSNSLNIAIIGGGIVGCCLAKELSKFHEEIFVFENNPSITRGENQSSRNSGVNHAGIYYDQEIRPLKARLCVEGNRLWYEFSQKYNVPCIQTGKLIVAVNEAESKVLDLYLQRSKENAVPGVRKLSGAEIKELEPNVSAHAALLVPTSGIFEPTALVHQVYALASNQGVQFMTETEVVGLIPFKEGVELRIRYRDGNEDTVIARWAINSAGVSAVQVARMIDPEIAIKPALIRGDSLKFYRNRRAELYLRGMNVYPTPIIVNTPTGQHHTVGVHLTPTFDKVNGEMAIGDTVTVGPKLIPVNHFEDYQTPSPLPQEFLENMAFFPGLTAADLQNHQGGIQARLDGYHDFYIKPDRTCRRAIHLLGIDSPGLTAAPAIAKYVMKMIAQKCDY